jgi:Flp pilus assembly protein CpaB
VKRSNRLLILLGILVAITGGILAVAVANGSGGGSGGGGNAQASPTPTPEPTVQVVIAKTAINLGDKITSDMLDVKTMTLSERTALGQDTFDSKDQVIGKIAGGTISAGQVLIPSRDFLNPGSMAAGQDIAGAIATKMVAVSMELDQVNGVGTLIVPGDHVDIILSVYTDQLSIENKDAAGNAISLTGGSQVTTKMVIQNRKILATLLPPVASAPTTAPVAGESAAPIAPRATTPVVQLDGRHMVAIIEVKPEEAEVIRWAQRAETAGTQNYITLAYALRSDKDNALADTPTSGVTFRMLVDKWGVLPPDPRGELPVDLAKGIQW